MADPAQVIRIRVAAAPARPVLIYDGECAFCRACVKRWQALTGERIDYAPSQEAAATYPEIAAEAFKRSAQFISTDGDVSSGAEAVFRTLAFAPGRGWLLWLYLKIPGFAWLSEALYAFVASHRNFFSKLTGWR